MPSTTIEADHSYNVRMQDVADAFSTYSYDHLVWLASALDRSQRAEGIDLSECQLMIEQLAIPTVLALIRRRLEVAELEGAD